MTTDMALAWAEALRDWKPALNFKNQGIRFT